MDCGPRASMIRVVGYVGRAIVGLALIIAGTTKAVHPATFIADIWSYRLIPEAAAYWVAAFLPWLEIVTGAALVTGRQLRGARLFAWALLLVFLGAILVSWIRGLDIACGCFGGGATSGAGTNYPWLVTRDLLLLACLAVDLIAAKRTAAPAP